MIHKISIVIPKWLAREGVISELDIELYRYAVYRIILTLIPVAISILCGLFCGMVQENVVFISTFMIIRKFSSGFHLESAGKCLLISSVILGMIAILLKSPQVFNDAWFMVVVFVSAISICMMSPIDSDAHQLSENEKRIFKVITRLIVFCTVCIYIAFVFAGKYWSLPFGMSIVLAASLQIPNIYKKVNKAKS